MKGDIFHILNRGVNKQKIFFSNSDYERFITSLYVFNNKNCAIRIHRKDFLENPPEQDKIVEILQWTLMPNHYHILLQEVVDGGAVEFTKRLGNGYTKYFNIKNNRNGYLFQNSAKIIQVEDNPHFLYLPFYVNLNPLKLVDPLWKEKGIKDKLKAIKFLESYKWGSVANFLGKENYSCLMNKALFFDLFETDADTYKKNLLDWINDPKE